MKTEVNTYEIIKRQYEDAKKKFEDNDEVDQIIQQTDDYNNCKKKELKDQLREITRSRDNLKGIRKTLMDSYKSIVGESLRRRQKKVSAQSHTNKKEEINIENSEKEEEYLSQMEQVIKTYLNISDFKIVNISNRYEEINNKINSKNLICTIWLSVFLSVISIIYSYFIDEKNDKDIEQFIIESIRNDSIINSKLDTIKMIHY